MKPLHQILPDLEGAVARRVPDPLVQQLGEGELRDLVYKLVDNYHRRYVDPDKWFDAMAVSVAERHSRFTQEKSNAKTVRAQILSRVLVMAGRVVPYIGGPVRVQIERGGADQQLVNDPLLRGIELASSRKQLAQSDGTRAIVGRTWAIVMLAGRVAAPDPRWAILDHVGSLDEKGFGQERITVSLSDHDELAEQLNDKMVGQILSSFAGQIQDFDGRRGPSDMEKIRAKMQGIVHLLRADIDGEPFNRHVPL